MQRKEYIQPDLNKDYFTCPICGENDNQKKHFCCEPDGTEVKYANQKGVIYSTYCPKCKKYTFWLSDRDAYGKFSNSLILYPVVGATFPMPASLPEKAKSF